MKLSLLDLLRVRDSLNVIQATGYELTIEATDEYPLPIPMIETMLFNVNKEIEQKEEGE